MENDIDIQEVSKSTTLREERLRKVKSNIEAMQKKMGNKNATGKTESNRGAVYREVISVGSKGYRQEESRQSEAGFGNYDRGLQFNSTLFKNIGNENQPVLENGSAVSNFSSVSNINNILNGNGVREVKTAKISSQTNNSIIDDIDKLLLKVNKTASSKMPVKAFGKYLDIKQSNQRNAINLQGLDNSIISEKSGEISSARSKLQEYKKFIADLEPIEEWKRGDNKSERSVEEEMSPAVTKFTKQKVSVKEISIPKSHQKSKLSNLSNRSELAVSENNFFKFPPTPPSQIIRQVANPVDRQKAMIKQTMQEYKRLQAEKSGELLDHSIDFELSDEESEDQKELHSNRQRVDELMREKSVLEEELRRIEVELVQLEDQD